ncbi:MAG TPA: transposase DNA-binding-containing protein [Candidatus Limnocylindrales bacterium]|jgi:hypothetical protein|nr:transposase DNA-binding-containing protein [Candidatus Limnocylindrales bacterium]
MKVIEERAIQDNQIEEEEGWAVTEFADADLQDAQRTKRLIEIATVVADKSGTSFPEACGQ